MLSDSVNAVSSVKCIHQEISKITLVNEEKRGKRAKSTQLSKSANTSANQEGSRLVGEGSVKER